jgi:hypothetical protein
MRQQTARNGSMAKHNVDVFWLRSTALTCGVPSARNGMREPGHTLRLIEQHGRL